MADRNRFDATASMVGYLYQCRYALLKAIEATRDRPGLDISIERFDDVAFEDDGVPGELLQTKHHCAGKGNLTDASSDLWKTLRVWAERIEANPAALFSTRHVLITTAQAPDDSAASMLRATERDEKDALRILEEVGATSDSQSNAAAYAAFFRLSPDMRLRLLESVTILDAAPDAAVLHAEIEGELHHAVPTQHLPALVQRLEGWWFGRIIDALSTDGAPPIPVIAVEAKIDDLREDFQRDTLPVDFAETEISQAILDEHDGRVFVRQLRQIQVAPQRIEWAIRDFYRAFEQRSKWARDELLVDGELHRYERRIVEAWQPRFAAACEDSESGDVHIRRDAGRQVYRWAENEADFPLRSVRERFLTHGSFHILANRLAVGWHPDFRMIETDDE